MVSQWRGCLQLIRTCEPNLLYFLFQQLGAIVAIVKHHIRKYLDALLAIVQEYWSNPSQQSAQLWESQLSLVQAPRPPSAHTHARTHAHTHTHTECSIGHTRLCC